MGLDGGTVVSRSDVLRGQSWRVAQGDTSRSTRGGNVTRVPKESAEKNVERSTAWSTCALSSQPLRPPIVACGLGRLYNKDAVLQFLLCKKGKLTSPEALLQYANQLRVATGGLDHLTGLKDVLSVHLTPAGPRTSGPGSAAAGPSAEPSAAAGPSGSDGAGTSAAGGGGGPTRAADGCAAGSFVCPITLLPCDRHPCSALRPCGHVVSDRALRNLGGDSTCPVCGAAFTSTLPILGTQEQVEALRERLGTEAGAAGSAAGGGGERKKGGARKRKAAEAGAGGEVGCEAGCARRGEGRAAAEDAA